ncbi:MAG: YidH family protein [Candidatus Heimdallarchaeota archaeon]
MKKNNRLKKEPISVFHVNTDELNMSDHLAVDRTSLANERTFLAYVRSALAISAVGFGLIKLIKTTPALVVFGWILFAIGIAVLVIGTIRFFQFRKSISSLICKYNIDEDNENSDIKNKEN